MFDSLKFKKRPLDGKKTASVEQHIATFEQYMKDVPIDAMIPKEESIGYAREKME